MGITQDLFIEQVKVKLKEFLDNDFKKQVWIESIFYSIYLRKSHRIINKAIVQCLDIATVDFREDLRGKGNFKALLTLVGEMNPYPYVFVENVLPPEFRAYFVKNNWNVQPDILPSYYIETKALKV